SSGYFCPLRYCVNVWLNIFRWVQLRILKRNGMEVKQRPLENGYCNLANAFDMGLQMNAAGIYLM
ncbi:hypothetical protein, partial [Paenibacillus taichungensis]|uniref:hypothetical protein n=1 Tax=Paenibacillus taichungensis TaxID=484184 RepID=UPI001C533704